MAARASVQEPRVLQAQPLVGHQSTRVEKTRYKYAKSLNAGFIEIHDKKLTTDELRRVFSRTPGVQELYLQEFKQDLAAVPGVMSVKEGTDKEALGNKGSH